MIALAAHDVTYRFPGATSDAVRGVSLALEPERIVAIVGVSGSGKSTLLACLAGLVAPTRGRVELAGGVAPRPGDVALVLQNPLHQIVASSLDRELAFSLEVRGVSPEAMRTRVREAISALGFAGREKMEPASLSAGECQRLVLRAVLMARSPVVLLDEPTTMLDPDGRRAVLAEVRRIASSGCAVGLVTQFPDEALGADHVIEMERGSIAASGTPRAVVGFDPGVAPRAHAPLTSAARLARDASMAGVRLESGVLTIEDLVAAIETEGAASPPRETESENAPRSLLDLRDAHLGTAPGSGRYIRDITLTARRGEATILVGPTGAGKTSVLLVAAGVLALDAGARDVRAGVVVATVLQYPERHFTERNVRDEIAGVAAVPGEDPQRILGELGLDPGIEDRSPFLLSVGEQRRLALALQMMRRPDVLIVDEPTAGLDPETAEGVRTALRGWMRRGGALLAATHDEDLVDTLGGTVHVMRGGAITWSGPVASLWGSGGSPPLPPPAWRTLARHPACRSREDLIRGLRRAGVRNA